MPAAAELSELQGPVGYSSVWTALAVGAIAATLLYYAAVLWFTRRRRPGRREAPPSVRRAHLRRIDEVESAVRSGAVPATTGHQQLSEAVRGFVAATGELRATSMTLGSSRGTAPESLTALLEDLYPPAFAGDEATAEQRFDDACRRAREVVATWT